METFCQQDGEDTNLYIDDYYLLPDRPCFQPGEILRPTQIKTQKKVHQLLGEQKSNWYLPGKNETTGLDRPIVMQQNEPVKEEKIER